MTKSIKGLLIAMVAATSSGVITAPNASADTIVTTTEYSTVPVLDYYSEPDTIILTEPAVIDTTPVIQTTPIIERQIITQPTIIRSEPVWRRDDSLFRIGVPGLLNLNLF